MVIIFYQKLPQVQTYLKNCHKKLSYTEPLNNLVLKSIFFTPSSWLNFVSNRADKFPPQFYHAKKLTKISETKLKGSLCWHKNSTICVLKNSTICVFKKNNCLHRFPVLLFQRMKGFKKDTYDTKCLRVNVWWLGD